MLAISLCVVALFSQASSQTACTADYCQNGGVCVVVLGNPACACGAGFSGSRCEIAPAGSPTNTLCGLQPCLNGGTCQASGDSFVCLCVTGYSGSVCQVQAQAPDTPLVTSAPDGPCENSPCLNGGTCSVSGESFTCTCPSSHIGTVCQLANVDTGITQAPQANCGTLPKSTKDNIGCGQAEVVFMIEYSRGDSRTDVDHEGDFIKAIITQWKVDDRNVRVGIVAYHDTVQEVVHIDDYANDPSGLINRITSLTRRLRPNGESNLAAALDYVRTTSFTNSRPGVEKVVVPIVHMMPNSTKDDIIPAAQRLKDQCVTIIGIGVANGGRYGWWGGNTGTGQNVAVSTLDAAILGQAVTQPAGDHYEEYRDFGRLENSAADWDDTDCGGRR